MRSLVVVLTLVAGGSLTSYAGSARADTPTCHGRPATIVGTRGQTITGTPGDDVVVTTGGTTVGTGAGDDLVCVVSSPGPVVGVEVEAGLGSDTVDTTGFDGGSIVYLSAGGSTGQPQDPPTDHDTFEGGYGPDNVHAATSGTVHIETGNGNDDVSTTVTTGDLIDLGDGNDSFTPEVGGDGNAVVDGGSGHNELFVLYERSNGDWTFDNTEGEASEDGVDVVGLSLFSSFVLDAVAHDLTFIGGPEAEQVSLGPEAYQLTGTFTATMGAGNDEVVAPAGHDRIDGGPGRDQLTIQGYQETNYHRYTSTPYVHLDLTRGTLKLDPALAVSSVIGMEDVTVDASNPTTPDASHPSGLPGTPEVSVVGSAAAEHLTVLDGGCSVRVDGRDGADTIVGVGGMWCPSNPNPISTFRGDGGDDVLLGDRGDDVLYGGAGDDVLKGGSGHDVVYGGPGTDRCEGEVRHQCEH